jgi:hypothetical protein
MRMTERALLHRDVYTFRSQKLAERMIIRCVSGYFTILAYREVAEYGEKNRDEG